MSSGEVSSPLSLPVEFRPLTDWLELQDDLSADQKLSILFVVRLADALYRFGYASFLTQSLVTELTRKLAVPGVLQADVDINAIVWSYSGCRGNLNLIHRIENPDFDGDKLQELSRVIHGTLEGEITAVEGLECIQKVLLTTESDQSKHSKFVNLYRNYPGRIVVPVLTSCLGIFLFDATVVASAFGAIAGLLNGILLYLASSILPQIAGVVELLAGVTTSMVLAGAYTAMPDRVCYTGQVLGTLAYFFYGTSYVISVYEMTNRQVATGLQRFAESLLKTAILAAGVVIGLWMAPYAGTRSSRLERVMQQDCSALQNSVSPFVFIVYGFAAMVGVLMGLRIAPQHWLICMVVQLVGLGSQFVLDSVLGQPLLIVNFVPVYLAVLAAHFAVLTASRFHVTTLRVPLLTYRFPTFSAPNKPDLPEPKEMVESNNNDDDEEDNTPLSRFSRRMAFVDRKPLRDASYQRSDVWFCVSPTLTLLVPGGSAFRVAFLSILQATWRNDYAEAPEDVGKLLSGLMIIGISQVIGVRLGFVTLALASDMYQLVFGAKRSMDKDNSANSTDQDDSTTRRCSFVPELLRHR